MKVAQEAVIMNSVGDLLIAMANYIQSTTNAFVNMDTKYSKPQKLNQADKFIVLSLFRNEYKRGIMMLKKIVSKKGIVIAVIVICCLMVFAVLIIVPNKMSYSVEKVNDTYNVSINNKWGKKYMKMYMS